MQHVILFVKVMISYLVPDKPEWVATAVASVEYQSKIAYKRQVSCIVHCTCNHVSSSSVPYLLQGLYRSWKFVEIYS